MGVKADRPADHAGVPGSRQSAIVTASVTGIHEVTPLTKVLVDASVGVKTW